MIKPTSMYRFYVYHIFEQNFGLLYPYFNNKASKPVAADEEKQRNTENNISIWASCVAISGKLHISS